AAVVVIPIATSVVKEAAKSVEAEALKSVNPSEYSDIDPTEVRVRPAGPPIFILLEGFHRLLGIGLEDFLVDEFTGLTVAENVPFVPTRFLDCMNALYLAAPMRLACGPKFV